MHLIKKSKIKIILYKIIKKNQIIFKKIVTMIKNNKFKFNNNYKKNVCHKKKKSKNLNQIFRCYKIQLMNKIKIKISKKAP